MNVTQPYWWQVNIGSGNGAVRQQAITWANGEPDLCRHMASLGHKELIGLYWPMVTIEINPLVPGVFDGILDKYFSS